MPTEEQTAELIGRVTRADEAVKEARKGLRTAERAGVDIQPQVTRLNELADKLKRVKTAYNIS